MSTITEHRPSGASVSRRWVLAIGYTALALACDNPLGPSGEDVGRLEVQPAGLTLVAGSSGSLTARVYDASGKEIAGRRVFWSSQNATIASVSATGTVSGLSPGSVQIAASSGGRSAIATVTVNQRPVSTVRVTPATTSVQVGSRTQLTVSVLDATGAPVPGKTVAWTSSSSAAASVSSTGEVTGVAAGSANISATVDGVSGVASVTVTAVPVASVSLTPPSGTVVTAQSLQLVATPLNAEGAPLAGRVVSWTSSNNVVATVSSTGLVTGLTPGRVTITATCETRTATSSVTVTLVPVDTVSVSPSTTTVSAASSVQLTVRLTDANGNVLNGRTITYLSEQPTIASVNASGLVTGLTQGQARITATSEERSGTALVTVSPVPIATLTVTPGILSLPIAGTGQLTATAKDGAGKVLPGRQITWLSGAPSVATVSQSGLVTGVGAGAGVVFAAAEGISASATVSVAIIPVAAVSVTPSTSNLQQGAFVQLTAICFDANSNVLLGRTLTWSSSNQAIAVVSSTGRVQSIAPGTVTITATCDGVSNTALITITAVPVLTVTVTPSVVSIIVAQTTTLLATPRDAAGNILTGRTVLWTSSAPAVATVNSNGDVTGVSAGSAIITATIDGVNGSASLTVSLVPVNSVSVSPSPVVINQGATAQLTASAFDASGNPLVGRPIAWTSSNASVATVSVTGLVTGVAPGAATITATSGSASGTSTVSVTFVPIATITVSPAPGSVVETGTLQLTATAFDASGNVLVGRAIVWSSNMAGVSVSQTGLVTAVANTGGQSALIDAADATAPATKGTSTVTVSYLPVTLVSVTPSPVSVTVSATQALTATLFNGALPLSPSGRTVAWSSNNTSVATVNPASGIVTGVAAGSATITVSASSPGQGAPVTVPTTVTVTIVPVASVQVVPGPTATVHLGTPYVRTFTAIMKDVSGNVLTGRTVVWTSGTQSVATVTSSGGVVAGVAVGTEIITGTSEGISGASTVTVDLVAVSTVTVSPSAATLHPVTSPTQTLSATPLDSAANTISGAALGGRATSWVSGNTAVATVSGTGLVTAIGAGASQSATAVITATIGGTNGTSTITVLAPVTALVLAIIPDSLILPGTLTGLTTISNGAAGPLSGRTVATTSGSTGVATVSPASATSDGSGNVALTVTGVSAGSATITSTSEGVSQNVTVRMLNAVASVVFTPGSATINIFGNAGLTIDVKDAGAISLRGRVCTIATADGTKATVAPSGSQITNASGQLAVTVTGVASTGGGTVNITATCEGKTGSAAITVP